MLVHRPGIPLAVRLTAANVNEGTLFETMVEAIEPIKRPLGRPRCRPAKLHADKAYDVRRCRAYLRRRGIACRIARKGIESSERLGRHRWTVERTIAWLTGHRRLATRYERRADILTGLLHLACSLIALRFLTPETGL